MKYYIGKDGLHQTDSSLQHWKYIRREKKSNGKYKYYYKNDQKKEEILDTMVGRQTVAFWEGLSGTGYNRSTPVRKNETGVVELSKVAGNKPMKQVNLYGETLENAKKVVKNVLGYESVYSDKLKKLAYNNTPHRKTKFEPGSSKGVSNMVKVSAANSKYSSQFNELKRK